MKDGTMRDYIDGTVDASIDLFDPTEDLIDGYECFAGNGSCASFILGIVTRKAEKAKDLYKAVDNTLEKAKIKVKETTNKNSITNYEINMNKEQFEKHLLDNGYKQKPNGPVDIFSKNGKKEFVTRNKSKSKDADGNDRPTADLYINNKKKAEVRLERDDG